MGLHGDINDKAENTIKHTAMISDLHLCEAEPFNPKFPLWKKFKTRQFFFDETFKKFLLHIQEKAQGEQVELVLNGDIFDFDSVMIMPDEPTFRIHWLERKRGLYPRPERSHFKIQTIIKHHPLWFESLRQFIQDGHRVVFIIGNHDLELHYPIVQNEIRQALQLTDATQELVRFCEWFYISNHDTLIEHGNQYDPYCVCEDPINPFSQGYNYSSLRLPFGNLACRYILIGMGFFNPHVDSNYIMSLGQYVHFFVKYIWRAQPLLVWDWFFGAVVTLMVSLSDRLLRPIRDPLRLEDKVNQIAQKANADARMVRELRELFVPSATTNPFLIAQELWLDRAFFVLIAFLIVLEIMLMVKQFFDVSIFWGLIPIALFLPFFLFYSKSITSLVSNYKEPDEKNLSTAAAITKVHRIVYGHTHVVRHEMIGAVEHLNSGCWSPAFTDVECTKAVGQKNFIWIEPGPEGHRRSQVLVFDPNAMQKI